MAVILLFTEGFDVAGSTPSGLLPKWDAATGSILAGRFGYGNSIKPSQPNSNSTLTKPLQSQLTYIGAAFALYRETPTDGEFIRLMAGISTSQLQLAVLPSGCLAFYRGTTKIAESSPSQQLQVGAWNHVEFRVYIHDTLGRVVAKVNEVTWIDQSNLDTKAQTASYIDRFNIVGAFMYRIDDLCVYTFTDFNDPYLGDFRIFSLKPNGSGYYSQWTPLSGSNWQNVDDIGAPSDTDYVYTSGAGNIDTYLFEDIVGSGTVLAVALYGAVRKDDAGVRSAKFVYRGAADFLSTLFSVPDSYSIFQWILSVNPSTSSAWVLSEINSAEFGIRMES